MSDESNVCMTCDIVWVPKEAYSAAIAQIESLTREKAELAEQVSEGKKQWDDVATSIGAVGDNVDDVVNKAKTLRAELDAAKLQVCELKIKYCESEVEREDTARARPGTAERNFQDHVRNIASFNEMPPSDDGDSP